MVHWQTGANRFYTCREVNDIAIDPRKIKVCTVSLIGERPRLAAANARNVISDL